MPVTHAQAHIKAALAGVANCLGFAVMEEIHAPLRSVPPGTRTRFAGTGKTAAEAHYTAEHAIPMQSATMMAQGAAWLTEKHALRTVNAILTAAWAFLNHQATAWTGAQMSPRMTPAAIQIISLMRREAAW